MGIMAYIFNSETQEMEYRYIDNLEEIDGLKDAEARGWYQQQVLRYMEEGDRYVYGLIKSMANNPESRVQ